MPADDLWPHSLCRPAFHPQDERDLQPQPPHQLPTLQEPGCGGRDAALLGPQPTHAHHHAGTHGREFEPLVIMQSSCASCWLVRSQVWPSQRAHAPDGLCLNHHGSCSHDGCRSCWTMTSCTPSAQSSQQPRLRQSPQPPRWAHSRSSSSRASCPRYSAIHPLPLFCGQEVVSQDWQES